MPKVHDGRITFERSRLDRAPAVRTGEIQDPSNTTWQRKAEQYWNSNAGSHDAWPQ
jgi:hypothetical protein